MHNDIHDAGEKSLGFEGLDQPPQNHPSILIVDNHAMHAGGLAALLSAMDCAAYTIKPETVRELELELRTRDFDLVVIRVQPGPRLAGSLDLVESAAQADVRVAVVSETTHDLIFAAAVEKGAVALLSTMTPITETVNQILHLARGDGLLTAERRAELLQLMSDHQSQRELRFLPFESLSRRESEVLRLLMEGMAVNRIAESSFVSVGTVRTQVKAVLRKLGVSSQVAAVALAYRSGWPEAIEDLPVDLRLQRQFESGATEN